LFFDGRSVFGWILTFGGVIVILVGIIANLQVYFSPTSLTNTMIMLGLLAAGVGLVARSLRSYSR
jgi:multisubunit Na+/H+ antiporter MnhF subunit